MRQAEIIPSTLEGVSFLSKKAGSFSGTPQSTVQLWTEKGLVSPEVADTTGTGKRRLYSPINVIEIGIIRTLSDRRVSFKVITEVMNFLHRKEITTRATAVQGSVSEYKSCPADRSNLEKLLDEIDGFIYIFFFDNNKFDVKGLGQSEGETMVGGMLDNGQPAETEMPTDIHHFIPELKGHEIVHLDELALNMAAVVGGISWLVVNISMLAIELIVKMKE